MGTGLIEVFAAAAITSFAVTPLIRRLAHRFGALDHPAERKSHARAVPRLGGVSVAVAWVAALGVAFFRDQSLGAGLRGTQLAPILAGGLLVFVVGAWDDVRPLSAGRKLLVETLAAAIVASAGILIERITVFDVTWNLAWLAGPATVLWILTITNAFNLLDGLDGLATGLAIIAGATCATIVLVRGDYPTAVILMAFLGGLVGFLPFNLSPASIFLGDSGSLLTGFVLAVTAITGWQKGATVLASGVPLLIFALPIIDTASAVIRRSTGSRSPFLLATWLAAIARPDHEHIHHRLVSRGLSPRGAVLVLYAVALSLSGIALLTLKQP